MRWIACTVVFIVTLVFFPPYVLWADEAKKIIVEVEAFSDDFVGRRLVFNIKEMIRKSYAMELQTYNYDDIPLSVVPRIKMIVRTIAKYKDNTSTATIYSVTWTLSGEFEHEDTWCRDRYLVGTLGYCGSARVEETAESLVADTDDIVEIWREALEVQPFYEAK